MLAGVSCFFIMLIVNDWGGLKVVIMIICVFSGNVSDFREKIGVDMSDSLYNISIIAMEISNHL